MRSLLTLLTLLPFIASAQIDTILVEGRASQLYSAMSATGLRNASLANKPSVLRDNFPVGVVLANSRATFYIWRNTCPSQSEDTVYMHIPQGGPSCWQRATNSYLVADWCLERVGDTFRIDLQCVWDSLNYYHHITDTFALIRAKIKADSTYGAATYYTKASAAASPASAITNAAISHWDQVYNSWILDSTKLVRTDRFYANPSWLTSLDVTKIPNAATTSYVDAGVNAEHSFAAATYQTKGNYLTTPQTLTISGRTLNLSGANSVALPKDTQTVSINANVLTLSNGGGSVSIPSSTYTAGAGISVASNVITNTSPNQTVTIASGTGITVSGSYPAFTLTNTAPAITYAYNNAPGRSIVTTSGATGYQISATRPASVSYTVSISTAISLLNLNSAGQVFLEISPTNTAPWTTINSAGISRTLSVSITVGLNEITYFNVQGKVPPGNYCRLRSVLSGGATTAFSSGQEVTE